MTHGHQVHQSMRALSQPQSLSFTAFEQERLAILSDLAALEASSVSPQEQVFACRSLLLRVAALADKRVIVMAENDNEPGEPPRQQLDQLATRARDLLAALPVID